jgi:VanZ family protein
MRKSFSALWSWGPAILLMVVIFGFSSIPAEEMLHFGLLDYIVKKGGHAVGYGLLGLSYLRGLKGENTRVEPRWYYIAWGLAVLYSATDEFHQSFVPGRHPAITDVIIDAFGAALALFLASRFYKQNDQPQ